MVLRRSRILAGFSCCIWFELNLPYGGRALSEMAEARTCPSYSILPFLLSFMTVRRKNLTTLDPSGGFICIEEAATNPLSRNH